jgi:hypothetical protein
MCRPKRNSMGTQTTDEPQPRRNERSDGDALNGPTKHRMTHNY